jgi:hypothetical protein
MGAWRRGCGEARESCNDRNDCAVFITLALCGCKILKLERITFSRMATHVDH